MTINDRILELTNQGLSKDQIKKDLMTTGHDEQQIATAFDSIFPNYPIEEETKQDNGSVSPLSILGGIFFIFVAIMRFARLSGSGGGGNIFMVLGVFTAIGMAFFFFTKKS